MRDGCEKGCRNRTSASMRSRLARPFIQSGYRCGGSCGCAAAAAPHPAARCPPPSAPAILCCCLPSPPSVPSPAASPPACLHAATGVGRTFFCSRYFLSRRRSTRIRRIHSTLTGIRASLAPFRLPWPVWRPLRFASAQALVRAREWTFCGLARTKPSLISLRMFCPARPRAEAGQAGRAQEWSSAARQPLTAE